MARYGRWPVGARFDKRPSIGFHWLNIIISFGKHKVITLGLEDWEVRFEDGSLPNILDSYLENAEFVDQIDLNNSEGRFLFLGFSNGHTNNGWPAVIVTQKYQDERRTFTPGLLLVRDTSVVFVGAGERLLCYDLEERKRLWEDKTQCGFWSWTQSGSFILMSAELEFGVWDQTGRKLWTTFVEPPWDFEIKDQTVALNVMGNVRIHRLSNGVKLV